MLLSTSGGQDSVLDLGGTSKTRLLLELTWKTDGTWTVVISPSKGMGLRSCGVKEIKTPKNVECMRFHVCEVSKSRQIHRHRK